MTERKRADRLGVGEEFEPYEFLVTPVFNKQYLDAQEDHHPRYLQDTDFGPPIVHPGLLINHSNFTRSPSCYLPPGMAAVHAKDEVEFLSPGRVGKTFRVTWKVIDVYEKRGRPYQVSEILISDEDGVEIMRRRLNATYISGSK